VTGAEIHDLGYTRYDGPRLAPARRFLVVARNVFAVGWRSRWGVKLPLIGAVATTVAAAVSMYFLRGELAETVRQRGAPLPRAEQIVYIASIFYEVSAFLIALAVGCRVIADDLRLGAFQFYFARALRPRDYVVGKLGGLALLIGIPMFAGPVLLSILRLVFADSPAQALALADVVPRAVALGLIGTAAYVLPAAGASALAARRQAAQALYAVYVMLIAPSAHALAQGLKLSWLRLLSVSSDLAIVGGGIFGVSFERNLPPVWAGAAALALIVAASLAAVWRRVRGATL
jgi:ABC-2 type transport system permease protein